MIVYPTVEDLSKLNQKILKEIRVKEHDKYRVKSIDALHEIIRRMRAASGDIYAKAAILFVGIVREHPFRSGNRRTGYAAAITFLNRNGYQVRAQYDDYVMKGTRDGFYTDADIRLWLFGMGIRPYGYNPPSPWSY